MSNRVEASEGQNPLFQHVQAYRKYDPSDGERGIIYAEIPPEKTALLRFADNIHAFFSPSNSFEFLDDEAYVDALTTLNNAGHENNTTPQHGDILCDLKHSVNSLPGRRGERYPDGDGNKPWSDE